ncbi:MAG: YceI family protein [Leptospiraceae bacterium]|nr:YceI family protein [Leptospiraceae bacterium]MBK7054488.1 YceI family protein [Leptospiraceae bacterium]MBK9502765.1 YceI family protein [Leptospiraceae bacterium]MBP9161817.1 YceI family protein [Leptospiraceae bacterium]
MKKFKIISLLVVLLFSAMSLIQAVEVSESKLKLTSGKILFVLVKTEWDVAAKMSGVADEFYGSVDVASKKVSIFASIKHDNFYLTGAYKYANDLMHEGYLESETYHTANFDGMITEHDKTSGDIKVVGKMQIHGVTKDSVEIIGKLKKSGKGYLFTSSFKINPKDYKMDPPKIKEVDVSVKFELTAN